jgi:hypothetical protein
MFFYDDATHAKHSSYKGCCHKFRQKLHDQTVPNKVTIYIKMFQATDSIPELRSIRRRHVTNDSSAGLRISPGKS